MTTGKSTAYTATPLETTTDIPIDDTPRRRGMVSSESTFFGERDCGLKIIQGLITSRIERRWVRRPLIGHVYCARCTFVFELCRLFISSMHSRSFPLVNGSFWLCDNYSICGRNYFTRGGVDFQMTEIQITSAERLHSRWSSNVIFLDYII